MKSFTAITLVVLLCCLGVALSYSSPAAKPKGRPFALPVKFFRQLVKKFRRLVKDPRNVNHSLKTLLLLNIESVDLL